MNVVFYHIFYNAIISKGKIDYEYRRMNMDGVEKNEKKQHTIWTLKAHCLLIAMEKRMTTWWRFGERQRFLNWI